MPQKDFVPVVPAGFEIAGTFNGVTTAVGAGGTPRIRYQIVGMQFRTQGIGGFVMKQMMTRGISDEVTLGSLHSKLAMALMLVGLQPETGIVERFDNHPLAGIVAGYYLDRETKAKRFGAMGLVKSKPGLVEVLVTECDDEAQSREIVNAALAPYL